MLMSPADSVDPVLNVSGKKQVVMLVDMHTTGAAHGDTKPQVNEAVLPVLLGAVNMVQRLQEDNVSIGLTVYNTSGSASDVIRLVAGLVADVNTTPAGVISMTSSTLTSLLSDLLRPTGVPHVHISLGRQMDDTQQDAADYLSTISRARVEATAKLLEVLHIRYFVLRALENPIAQNEAAHFRQLVHKSETLCQVPSPDARASRAPTVVFTGSDDNDEDIDIGDEMSGSRSEVVVVVGDGVGHVTADVTWGSVLWLQEILDVAQGDLDALLNTDPSSSLPWLNASSCTHFTMDTGTRHLTTPSPQPQPCPVAVETVRQTLAVRDALVALATGTEVNSTENPLPRNGSQPDLGKLDDVRSTSAPAWSQDELAVLDRGRFELSVYGKDMVPEDARSTTTFTFPSGTLAVPSSLLTRDVSSQCDVNCHLCDVCTPTVTSDEKIMVSPSLQDKTLLVAGMFPIHKFKSTDTASRECAEPNTVGLAAAQAFMSTVENHKNRTPSGRLRGISLGSVVFDSCGENSREFSIAQQVESCFSSYENSSGGVVSVSPSEVAAYAAYSPFLEDSSFHKILLGITDTGYSFGSVSRAAHLAQIAKVLVAMNWTFVKAVVHKRDSLTLDIKEILKSQGVCADIETVGNLDISETVARLMRDSTAVVFLTNGPDTRRVLSEIASLNTSARMKYFLASWNWELAQSALLADTAEVVLLPLPTLAHSVNFHAENVQFDNPWREDFASSSVASGEVRMEDRVRSVVTLAVDRLVTELDVVYRELCPQQKGVCEEMRDLTAVRDRVLTSRSQQSGLETVEMDILALRPTAGNGWEQVGEVNSDGSVMLSNMADRIPASICPDWCPQCLACPSLASPTSDTATAAANGNTDPTSKSGLRPTIFIPGEILVAGVLPVRQSGPEPFQCGDLNDDSEEARAEQAFLFAVETARQRYSSLLPHVSVGGILLDSCSDLATVLHVLGEFQSCRLDVNKDTDFLKDEGYSRDYRTQPHPPIERSQPLPPSPSLVVGYLIQDDFERAAVVRDTVRGLSKMVVVSAVPRMSEEPESGGVVSQYPTRLTVNAVLSIFTEFKWTQAYVVTSGEEEFVDMAEYLVDVVGSRGVCVVKFLQLLPGARNADSIASTLSHPDSASTPVVVFLPRADAVTLFRDRELSSMSRPWVISMIGDDWLSTVGVNIPWGALLIDVQGKVNDDFQVFLEQFSVLDEPTLAPWWRTYLQTRHQCQPGPLQHTTSSSSLRVCEENPLMSTPSTPSATASRVIRGVDAILHAVDARYKVTCRHADGICGDMSKDILQGRLSLADASFTYEEGRVSFTETGEMAITLSILSYQPGQLVMAGTYRATGLTLNNSLVQFFATSGEPLVSPSFGSRCPDCTCINLVANLTRGHTPTPTTAAALSRDLWWAERGVFVREVWTWTVLAIAVGGALVSMFFIFYVLFKVWQGALSRRYIGLGLVLLVSLMLLYLACLPFLFTPSPSVCGLRYLYPACAHCLVLACLLVKLMALQDYRRIGLGGELSGINQGLSIFFVILVQ
ncbi:hypothetical protein BaRGS_00005206, partial [Batillaria attramentaria]